MSKLTDFFGIEFRRKKQDKEAKLQSFAEPDNQDGSIVTQELGLGAFSATTLIDLSRIPKTESELITKYRALAREPEAELAIDDVVNEAITFVPTGNIVDIVLDDVDTTRAIKNKMAVEFDEIYKLFDFQNQAYEIFRRWYVDGRIYYHVMIDPQNLKKGIQELRYIDPRKIRKITKLKKTKKGVAIIKEIDQEFFIYSENFFSKNVNTAEGLKIGKDSIVSSTSGLMRGPVTISWLDKALKPFNQLRVMEDSLVIYRVTRAPERRVFYIDVGNLPKMKAEQYLRDMMVKYKNKMVYDTTTGKIKDDRKLMTMLEDFWLPRREGGKGTEITQLAGGENLGQIEDVIYFQRQFYKALHVPMSRLDSDGTFNIGRPAEITRDEIKFSKFVDRLRMRFSKILLEALEKQLILKGIVTSSDWKDFKACIKFEFEDDSHFAEIKNGEILRERINTANEIEPFIGKYYSNEWVRRNILIQTEDDIKEMDKQMAEEENSGEFDDDDEDDFDDAPPAAAPKPKPKPKPENNDI